MTDLISQSRLSRWWAFRPRIFKITTYNPGFCPPYAPYVEYVVAWGGKWRFRIVPEPA